MPVTPQPARTVLVAAQRGAAAQTLADGLARRGVICLYADDVPGLHRAFASARADLALLDGAAATPPEALRDLAKFWPHAKTIVVGAWPPAGHDKLDFQIDEPDSALAWKRAEQVALQFADRTSPRRTVLAIDDSRTFRALAAAALEPAGYPTLTVASIEAGLRLLERVRFAAVLTDVFMDGVGGIEGIQMFRSRAPGLAMVAMSGGLDERMAKDHALAAALKIGADRVVAKPFRPEVMVEAIEAALQSAQARAGVGPAI